MWLQLPSLNIIKNHFKWSHVIHTTFVYNKTQDPYTKCANIRLCKFAFDFIICAYCHFVCVRPHCLPGHAVWMF